MSDHQPVMAWIVDMRSCMTGATVPVRVLARTPNGAKQAARHAYPAHVVLPRPPVRVIEAN